MKLKKALSGYYREQMDAVDIIGGKLTVKTGARRAGSRMFNFAFHAVLIVLIVTAMISGYYQPSHLEERMHTIVNRYNIEDRLTDSFESLIIIIQKNRNDGGKL